METKESFSLSHYKIEKTNNHRKVLQDCNRKLKKKRKGRVNRSQLEMQKRRTAR